MSNIIETLINTKLKYLLLHNSIISVGKIFFLAFLLINSVSGIAQVKIGDNPNNIDNSSILELESSNKVLVITRLNTLQINALTPLNGAIVYNTDDRCVHVFDGIIWKNLCNASGISVTTSTNAPISNNTGDVWVDNSNNDIVHIWDGTKWIPVNANPKRGSGTPTLITAPNSNAGDIYVDTLTGDLYTFDGTNWINQSSTINASNGLTKNTTSNSIELGGNLTQPTSINTTPTNTLAINGLEQGDITTDEIVTVNSTTGEIRKINSNNLFREEVAVITANNGQIQFTPPLLISDSKKVNVFRNGVRIDFVVVNNTTIEIEPEATCYQGDQIRIVQFY